MGFDLINWKLNFFEKMVAWYLALEGNFRDTTTWVAAKVLGCIPYRFKEGQKKQLTENLLKKLGVLGIVECQLGQWNFISKRYGTYYEGHMFPLFVKEQLDLWPEKNVRQRIWMTVPEAIEVCQHWWMKEA
ncbi:Nudix hydrolase mitochondrial-like [Quillaja saponaria]|uniref:Nudix hydrolase mitochondrial-like n=1 Tax=Quillaja saponaria TaxID=32244 RepID=A0AAD7LBG0_QUISA|nr:Nudix hydrolase mitochondrial-like [Quillaja saponaria]